MKPKANTCKELVQAIAKEDWDVTESFGNRVSLRQICDHSLFVYNYDEARDYVVCDGGLVNVVDTENIGTAYDVEGPDGEKPRPREIPDFCDDEIADMWDATNCKSLNR